MGDQPIDHGADPAGSRELLLPSKRDVTLLLLEKGTVYLHLDPRRAGVDVPAWLKTDSHVVLQFGRTSTFPIRELHIDDEQVSATLFFQGVPHSCVIPWPAIFAIVSFDQRGMAWPDDVPADVSSRADTRSAPASPLDAKRRTQEARFGGCAADDHDRPRARLPSSRPSRQKLPPYLRVIK